MAINYTEGADLKINEKFELVGTTPKRYIYLDGGRGGGKSTFIAIFASLLTFEKVGNLIHRILFTRYTMTSAEKSIIPEFTGVIDSLGLRKHFKVTKNSIINKETGSEILFSGIKTSSGNQTANLKSLPGITTWIYDEFEEHPDEESFNVISRSIRQKGIKNRVILVSNAIHKKSWQYQRFFDKRRHQTEIITTTYLENAENLDESFLEEAEWVRLNQPDNYRRAYLGIHYDSLEGALWRYADIEHVDKIPTLRRIVVAVDPAVSAKKNSDETGIVTVGAGVDGRYYVLSDLSGVLKPLNWARRVVREYNLVGADVIVGEQNQGGDLVESNIKNIDDTVNFKKVVAAKGKYLRAEPVAALYAQKKVLHYGKFDKLEYQMISWVPEEDDDSPDRVDALVYGVTELMKRKEVFTG